MSWAEGSSICMPPAFMVAMERVSTSRDSFQPRASAAAAAFSTASCWALSSALKAFLLTTTAFLGIQACTL
ncbi:hypothetical protein D3C80_2042160 [compost metagenome]